MYLTILSFSYYSFFFESFSFSPLLCYYVSFCIWPHTLTFPKASAQCLDKHKMSCSHRIDTHKGRYGVVKVVQVIPLVLLTTCNRWWGMMFECRGVVERVVTLMRNDGGDNLLGARSSRIS